MLAIGTKGRLLYMSIKNQVKGHVNREVMEYNYPHGNMPIILKKNKNAENELKKKYPYFLKHIKEKIHSLPGGDIMGGFQNGNTEGMMIVGGNARSSSRSKL